MVIRYIYIHTFQGRNRESAAGTKQELKHRITLFKLTAEWIYDDVWKGLWPYAEE